MSVLIVLSGSISLGSPLDTLGRQRFGGLAHKCTKNSADWAKGHDQNRFLAVPLTQRAGAAVKRDVPYLGG